MPRPNKSSERRKELLPVIAAVFAERGYRRSTTAELAKRCGVRENILYRLWTDKKAMFIAAIDYVFDLSQQTWRRLGDVGDGKSSAAHRLLDYEAGHHGEFGLYRIVFAGLSETDDPEIRAALGNMYVRFHKFIRGHIVEQRAGQSARSLPDASLSAWAVIGLGTLADIGRELGLLSSGQRKRLIAGVGRLILEGKSA